MAKREIAAEAVGQWRLATGDEVWPRLGSTEKHGCSESDAAPIVPSEGERALEANRVAAGVAFQA